MDRDGLNDLANEIKNDPNVYQLWKRNLDKIHKWYSIAEKLQKRGEPYRPLFYKLANMLTIVTSLMSKKSGGRKTRRVAKKRHIKSTIKGRNRARPYSLRHRKK